MQFDPSDLWIPDLEIPYVYGAFLKSRLNNIKLYFDQLQIMGFTVDSSRLHELRNISSQDLIFLLEKYCKDLFNEITSILEICDCNLRVCKHCNLHKSRQLFMDKIAEISCACHHAIYIYLNLIDNDISNSYLNLQKDYLSAWIKTKIIISDSDKYTHLDPKLYIIFNRDDTRIDLPKNSDVADILIMIKSPKMLADVKSMIKSKKRTLS